LGDVFLNMMQYSQTTMPEDMISIFIPGVNRAINVQRGTRVIIVDHDQYQIFSTQDICNFVGIPYQYVYWIFVYVFFTI
jgi:hypothetical protein